jgi:hypothetical protein
MARHDARCVGTVAADSAALIWDASAPFFICTRPFLVTPRWPLFSWRECYLAGTNGQCQCGLIGWATYRRRAERQQHVRTSSKPRVEPR